MKKHQFNVLWYQIYSFFTCKHQDYLSFAELNVLNRYLWRPQLINVDYNYLLHWDNQNWLYFMSFFTKHLKWLSLTLSNVIYSYLWHSQIFLHLEKSTRSHDYLTMKCYTNDEIIINHTLILNLIYYLLNKFCVLWKTFRVITLVVATQPVLLEATITGPKCSQKSG